MNRASGACCGHMGSHNPRYLVVSRASSQVQMIRSERDSLEPILQPGGPPHFRSSCPQENIP